MKTTKILLITVLLNTGCLLLPAQNLVKTNISVTKDTLLTILEEKDISSKNVLASGQAVFPSKTGYVRILLSTDSGYDLLVYESSPLVAPNGIDDFNNSAMETINIPSFSFTKLRVEIKDAELRNLSVDISDATVSKAEQQKAKTDRITLINDHLRERNMLWAAGETSISQMSYEEKKGLFGGKVPDLQGFEYYVGGIFELNDETPDSGKTERMESAANTPASNYISSFDWRNRHNANNPSSPYYNSGGHGWITSVKNQSSCGSCGVFAVIGTIESLTNLYYNRFLNKDLSEQDIVSCFPTGSCATNTGWFPGQTVDYIVTNGVCEEACFPYTATDLPCSDKCPAPTENIKVSGRINCGTTSFPKTVDGIKKSIIQYGPISGGILNFSHAMSMIGYKEIQAGDTIYTTMSSYTIIPSGDSRIGQTAWLFKNSWGTSWGKSGFGYILLSSISNIEWTHIILSPVTSPNYTDADIVCEDRDGDGYYFWGVGPKPATCPACAPDEPDGDDSNPNLGPMDEYGNCEPITPLVENITSSQTWNTNRTLCRNLVIQSGATLTVTATVFMQAHKVSIQNGGKIILSGGTIDNGNVIAQSGSELTITNNGKILLGSYDNLDIQLGALFNNMYGKVSLKQ
jgi:hypothetical protein